MCVILQVRCVFASSYCFVWPSNCATAVWRLHKHLVVNDVGELGLLNIWSESWREITLDNNPRYSSLSDAYSSLVIVISRILIVQMLHDLFMVAVWDGGCAPRTLYMTRSFALHRLLLLYDPSGRFCIFRHWFRVLGQYPYLTVVDVVIPFYLWNLWLNTMFSAMRCTFAWVCWLSAG